MAVLIKHNFVSPIVDEQAPGEVGPDEWNDDHTITGLDKDAVGLGSVDNTSDADKPVSTAQQTALDLKANTADLATVATTGDYNDLINTPSIPTGDMTKAVYDPNSVEDDAFDQDNMADGTTNKNFTATEKTKLAGIETAADVTDAANVAAAGAFMKASDDSDDITEGASKLLMTTSERSAIASLSATYQPIDSDLTSWAGVARASGYDTFAATPTSANLRSLLTDETGTGSAVFANSPALVTPTGIVKGDVGLGNVDNTSDASKTSTLVAAVHTWALAQTFTVAPVFTDKPNSQIALGVREVLTANRTYYVSTAGSDSANGLTVGAPFATLNKARDVIMMLDLNGFTVTIQHAGSQTPTSGLAWLAPPVGGLVILDLGGSTLTTTSGHAIVNSAPFNLTVQNGTISTVTSGNGILANVPGAKITVGSSVSFGAIAQKCLRATGLGYVLVNAGATFAGNAQAALSADALGQVVVNGGTLTQSGTPAFSVGYADATVGGLVYAVGVAFTGSATGPRYNLGGGIINVGGGGTSYFPGSTSGVGTATTGNGFYL